MHNKPLFFCLAIIVAASASKAQSASIADFTDFSLSSGATTLLPGRLFIPPAVVSDPLTPRPFILFLHGAGESGVNNVTQVNGNIDNLLAEAKRRNAFLYAPQTNGGWSSTAILDRVKTMIDQALTEQPVDSTRLYATGLSMGGGGTWNMLSRYPNSFAAGVPICGVSPAAGFAAGNLVDQALWTFHAGDDSVVSYITTRNVVIQILSAAGEPAPPYAPRRPTSDFEFASSTIDLRHSEFQFGGHGIWNRVYGTPATYEWMFSHSTAVPEPTSAMLILAAAGVPVILNRRPRTANVRRKWLV